MNKRENRSSHYQQIFAETMCSNEMMASFCNEDSISSRLNPFQYSEDLLDLEDELKKEFWRIVEEELTDRQKEVLRLYAEGLTQTEIAKKLHVNQSSVAKNVGGNQMYSNSDSKTTKTTKTPKRTYGGSKRKLKKIIEIDPRITDILQKMAAIRADTW